MDKLIISETQVENSPPDWLYVNTSTAAKYLQALRDNYFKQCRIVPVGGFKATTYRFLINLARVLNDKGKIIFETSTLQKTQINEVQKLLTNLGYLEQSINQKELVYSKKSLIAQTIVQKPIKEKLHIGFQKIEQKKEQLIDQDELLKNDVVEKKAKVEKQNCNTKPKACSNCSCGRKEVEQKMTKEQAIKNINQGKAKMNCGSCSLGDAFRCAACPYRGLPAFKAGQKISINLNEDILSTSEVGKVNVTGGKVKLEL